MYIEALKTSRKQVQTALSLNAWANWGKRKWQNVDDNDSLIINSWSALSNHREHWKTRYLKRILTIQLFCNWKRKNDITEDCWMNNLNRASKHSIFWEVFSFVCPFCYHSKCSAEIESERKDEFLLKLNPNFIVFNIS